MDPLCCGTNTPIHHLVPSRGPAVLWVASQPVASSPCARPPFFIIMWKCHCPEVVLLVVVLFQPDGWTVSATELIPETTLSSHHTAGARSPVVCCAGHYDSRRGPVRRCECECDCASTLWALRGLARLRGAFARNSSANNRQAARGERADERDDP